MRTWPQIKALSAQKLQDTGMAIYLTAELDQYLTEALMELSHVLPRYVKYTLTTVTTTKDITLTAEQYRNMMCVGLLQDPYIEYPVDLNPKSKHNFTRIGTLLSIIMADYPSGDSAYLYIGKKHILPAVTLTDLAGDVQTTAAAGASSVLVHGLGTEAYVPEDTTFTIAGDSTVYTVTQNCTIAANAATLVFSPVLAAEATADAVVTLVNPVSTLEYAHEELVACLVAGLAMRYKPTAMYNTLNTAITDLTPLATAIGDIADQLAAAVSDIGTGRTEAAKVSALIDSAATEVAKITTALGDVTASAKADLASARAIIGTIDNSGAVSHYLQASNGQVNLAQGFLTSAVGYLREASQRDSGAGTYIGLAARQLNSASVKVQEAQAYGSKIAHEVQIAGAGRTLQATGENLIADTQRKMRRMVQPRTYTLYPEY
jgi:hypothetical protein